MADPEEEAQGLKLQGNQAFEAGNHDEAARLFSEAIRALNNRTTSTRGQEASRSDRPTVAGAFPPFTTHEAGREASRAAVGAAQDAMHGRLLSALYSNRSAVRLAEELHVQALVDAKLAAKHDPAWPKPYLRQAAALCGMRRYRDALHALEAGLAACKQANAGAAQADAAGGATASSGKGSAVVTGLLEAQASVAAAAAAATRARAASKRRRLEQYGLLGGLGQQGSSASTHAAAGGQAASKEGQARVPASHGLTVPPSTAFESGSALVEYVVGVLDAAARRRGWVPGRQPDHRRVGLTVVSGFLGSGKTTLLQHILQLGQVPEACMGPRPGTTGAGAAAAAAHDDAAHDDEAAASGAGHTSAGCTPTAASSGAMHACGSCSHGAAAEGHAHTHAAGHVEQEAVNLGRRFAVIVNDLAAVNVDAQLVRDAAVGSTASAAAAVGAAAGAAAGARPGMAPGASGAAAGQSGTAEGQVEVVEMANGCICCGLKGDLLLELGLLLAQTPEVGYVVVEATGVGQPAPIAAALASTDSRGRSLLDYVRLDTMVTVVDASRFQGLMRTTCLPGPGVASAAAGPADAGHANSIAAEAGAQQQLDPEDQRPLAELLAEQVEFADVVLLNKCDLLGGSKCDAELAGVEVAVAALNQGAKLIRTVRSACDPQEVIGSRRFDLDKAQASARWHRELLRSSSPASAAAAAAGGGAQNGPGSVVEGHEEGEGEDLPETLVYGISSFVYEARRPFHPARLWAWLHRNGRASAADGGSTSSSAPAAGAPLGLQQLVLGGEGVGGTLLRSKGFFWVACTPQVCWEWSTAGPALSLRATGQWLAGMLPAHCWPEPGAREGWDPKWGDRKSALVFIGQGRLPEAAIRASLEACLVTNEEAEAEDGEAWEALEGGEWKQMLGEDDGWLGNRQDAL